MASLVLNGNTSGSVTISSPAVSGTTTLTLPTTTGTLVVTSGAQTIEFADGSASAPSITNSGDTNTGIFFPTADTIAFAEGGAEAMRLDASGNVGIGTTSPAYKLDVQGSVGSTIASKTAEFNAAGGSIYSSYNDGTKTYRVGAGIFAAGQFSIRNQTDSAQVLDITAAGLLQFNSGYGSVATAYGCRAWVNFNGTGTVAIRASGNVTSITDNGTGDYTVNFTTAMPDANYATTGTAGNPSGQQSGQTVQPISDFYNTGSVRIGVGNSSAFLDRAVVSIAVFR